MKEAGIKDLRIHDLHHTHASHLVSSGLSFSIVGKLLGHTQASTTQRYAHLADEPNTACCNRNIWKEGWAYESKVKIMRNKFLFYHFSKRPMKMLVTSIKTL